jgi:hypothetical protein
VPTWLKWTLSVVTILVIAIAVLFWIFAPQVYLLRYTGP